LTDLAGTGRSGSPATRAVSGPNRRLVGDGTHRDTKRSRLLSLLAAAAILLICDLHAQATGSLVGKVVTVNDGDTILVLHAGQSERVRLYGIDAPEGGQAFGTRARQFLSELVFGKVVEVEVRDLDRYGRTVGRVLVEGRDAGLELVRVGLAWHYTRYSKAAALAAAEREAREAHRGLWAHASPLAPWDFRRSGSGKHGVADAVPVATGAYHGNLRSRVFHAPGCPHYDCPNCQAQFTSVLEAQAAGYRRHTACVR
jgi:micrococcal nuclease